MRLHYVRGVEFTLWIALPCHILATVPGVLMASSVCASAVVSFQLLCLGGPEKFLACTIIRQVSLTGTYI
jgi:hypothetical protein